MLGAPSAGACTPVMVPRSLDRALKETSGLTRGVLDSTLLWTHNDGGNPATLYALHGDARLARTVAVAGASNADWEDIAAAPCPDGRPCLFIADIGDNIARRKAITIYRIAEPPAGATRTEPATALLATYPGGARDAEALFALPSGDLYVVTKGRSGPIELFELQQGAAGRITELRLVRQLLPRPATNDDRVTGAAASPDGEWVGVRTYRTLRVYRTADLVGQASTPPAAEFDLGMLKEKQGEGLWLGNDGTAWLTSEGSGLTAPKMSAVRCRLPEIAR